jgi:hypothetical protein
MRCGRGSGKHLAGHVGREAYDPAARPAATWNGAGKHEPAAGQPKAGERAEQLRFLAAHDVPHAGMALSMPGTT